MAIYLGTNKVDGSIFVETSSAPEGTVVYAADSTDIDITDAVGLAVFSGDSYDGGHQVGVIPLEEGEGGWLNSNLQWTNPEVADIDGLSNALSGKQATLVSGTNIKTINNTSLLGSDNLNLLPLTGGAVTGQVNFTDSISLLDATVGDLLVTGQASIANRASLTNATVGSLSVTGTGTVAANTNYTGIQLRNIFFSTTVPASSTGNNGDICIVYTA